MNMTNDEKILQLKSQIEAKREKIGATKKFSPTTSCSLEMDGTRYNLHTLSKHDLTFLLCKLESLNNVAKSHDLAEYLVFNGYTAENWIADIQQKLDVLTQKADIQALDKLELKLESMLSDDKKIELELDSIANLLKD